MDFILEFIVEEQYYKHMENIENASAGGCSDSYLAGTLVLHHLLIRFVTVGSRFSHLTVCIRLLYFGHLKLLSVGQPVLKIMV